MKKFLKIIWILNLVFLAYSTPAMLWQTIFQDGQHSKIIHGEILAGVDSEILGVFNKASSNMDLFLQKLTPEQNDYLDRLKYQTEIADEVLLALFITVVSAGFVAAAMYGVNRRDPENPVVRYVTANKRRIFRYTEAAIILFWIAATASTMYPIVYELNAHNANFQDRIRELRD
jgi:hypothetical protein